MQGLKKIALPLAAGLLALAGAACSSATNPNKIDNKMLTAVAGAHITTDASRQDDPQGLRDRNFGDQDFIAVSYANKLQAEEQLVVVGLTKFDLNPVKNLPIQSAILQMYALRADLAQPARLVDVSPVEGDWDGKSVTYNNRPAWSGNPIATTALYGGGVWYSWDVTPSLQGRTDNISYVLGLRTVEEKKGEQVLFASQNAGVSVAPRLIVTYAVPETVVPVWSVPAAGVAVAVVAVLALLFVPRLLKTRQVRPVAATA